MKFAIIDTETTGLKADTHRIIEVAYQLVELSSDGVQVLTPITERRFRPGPSVAYEQTAYACNGYFHGHTDWLYAPEVDSPEAKESWTDFVKDVSGAQFAGHNVEFDRGFVLATLERLGIPHHIHYKTYDTSGFVAMVAAHWGLKSWKLAEAFEALCGSVSNYGGHLRPHRAAGDVTMVKHLMRLAHQSVGLLKTDIHVVKEGE